MDKHETVTTSIETTVSVSWVSNHREDFTEEEKEHFRRQNVLPDSRRSHPMHTEILATVDPVNNVVNYERTDGKGTWMHDFDMADFKRAAKTIQPIWPGDRKLFWARLLPAPRQQT